jgi:formate dehydrogenase subunit gamma
MNGRAPGEDVMADQHANAVRDAIATHKDTPGALLPILHDIQDRLGHVPADSIKTIATGLNLSRADVHGVVTFYHHFRSAQPGKHVVRICRAEACQSMGSEDLVAHVEASLQTKIGETSKDGRFTLESVYCLGNCACSPALMIGDDLHGRVSPGRFDAIVKELG